MRKVIIAVIAGAVLAVPPSAGAATIYAASSLRDVFTRVDSANRFSFLGSNTLQLQIERGAPADVFAAASTEEPTALRRQGLCTAPRLFATNRLVLIVPSGNPSNVRSLYSLTKGRRRLAIGTPGVPVGDYTRKLLRTLKLGSILTTNIVSQEAAVAGIVSKVALGSADAGIVYVTDARIADGRVGAISLPAKAQPRIDYAICRVLRSGADVTGANRFIAKVLAPRGRRLIAAAGFGVPPKHKR